MLNLLAHRHLEDFLVPQDSLNIKVRWAISQCMIVDILDYIGEVLKQAKADVEALSSWLGFWQAVIGVLVLIGVATGAEWYFSKSANSLYLASVIALAAMFLIAPFRLWQRYRPRRPDADHRARADEILGAKRIVELILNQWPMQELNEHGTVAPTDGHTIDYHIRNLGVVLAPFPKKSNIGQLGREFLKLCQLRNYVEKKQLAETSLDDLRSLLHDFEIAGEVLTDALDEALLVARR